MSPSSHLPDQPIMEYVHPTDRLRPRCGVGVGLAALVGMLAFGVLGRNFGTLEHLKALYDADGWLAVSLIEASAGILALLLATVALGERIERGGWRDRTSSDLPRRAHRFVTKTERARAARHGAASASCSPASRSPAFLAIVRKERRVGVR